jgi:hypothetical protein
MHSGYGPGGSEMIEQRVSIIHIYTCIIYASCPGKISVLSSFYMVVISDANLPNCYSAMHIISTGGHHRLRYYYWLFHSIWNLDHWMIILKKRSFCTFIFEGTEYGTACKMYIKCGHACITNIHIRPVVIQLNRIYSSFYSWRNFLKQSHQNLIKGILIRRLTIDFVLTCTHEPTQKSRSRKEYET